MPFSDHLDEVPVLLVLVVELAQLAVMDNGLDRQSIAEGFDLSIRPQHPARRPRRRFGRGHDDSSRPPGTGGQRRAWHTHRIRPGRHVGTGTPVKVITKLKRAEVSEFTTVDRFDGAQFSPLA